jgi:Protein of unknown function (DUF5672)
MKKISAVVVDTFDSRGFLHLAINQILSLGFVNKIYSISHKPIIQGEHFYKINKINSISDYSSIILNFLPYIIEEEHFFIFQWDGFPINKDLWDEEFLKYDYIGAPWPQIFDGRNVGNGGFSLRSRRLLDAFICINNRFSRFGDLAEDEIICQEFRNDLENLGVFFAPQKVAAIFSYENGNLVPSFGMHAAQNFPLYLDEEFLTSNMGELQSKITKNSMIERFNLNSKIVGYKCQLNMPSV